MCQRMIEFMERTSAIRSAFRKLRNRPASAQLGQPAFKQETNETIYNYLTRRGWSGLASAGQNRPQNIRYRPNGRLPA